MKKRTTKKDIRDVMAEEMGRGKKRKIDSEAQEQTKRLKSDYRQVIRESDFRQFQDFLNRLGLPEEQYQEVMEIWNEVQRERNR